MTLDIRPAVAADAEAALALDPDAPARLAQPLRQAFAGQRGRSALLALMDGQAVGYAAIGDFLGQPFLERLRVADGRQRQGVASALMAALEAAHPDRDIFVSSNESNTPMRTLLAARDYKVSGIVENLDPGDPQLFFVKFAPWPPSA